MDDLTLFVRFGVALIVGILVGLERQYDFAGQKRELFAGIRTFSLISLIGCAAAFTADILASPWPFVGIVLVMGALLTVSYFTDASQGKTGLTTESSAILTLLAGALIYWGHTTVAVALAVVTTVLLSAKPELHRFAKNLTQQDMYAALKLAVITVVILPILPDKTFGPPPFDVFNPYKIWLLVVFISGISFIGYVMIKVVGAERGISLVGLLGGLASSTAVTLSFVQRSQRDPTLSKTFALAIILSWTVMFARVIVVVVAVNVALVRVLWWPISVIVLVGSLYSLFLFFTQKRDLTEKDISFSNPFELGPALAFGLIFTLVLFISKAAQFYFGDAGLYISSFVSGFGKIDAITLSLAELSHPPSDLTPTIATRALLLAVIANTLTKGGLVLASGAVALRKAILPGFLLMVAVSILTVFLV